MNSNTSSFLRALLHSAMGTSVAFSTYYGSWDFKWITPPMAASIFGIWKHWLWGCQRKKTHSAGTHSLQWCIYTHLQYERLEWSAASYKGSILQQKILRSYFWLTTGRGTQRLYKLLGYNGGKGHQLSESKSSITQTSILARVRHAMTSDYKLRYLQKIIQDASKAVKTWPLYNCSANFQCHFEAVQT